MQGLLVGATPAGGAPPGGQAGSPRPTRGSGVRVTPATKRLRTGVMKIRPTNVDEATAAFLTECLAAQGGSNVLATSMGAEDLRDALGHARAEAERMQLEVQRLRAFVAQLQGCSACSSSPTCSSSTCSRCTCSSSTCSSCCGSAAPGLCPLAAPLQTTGAPTPGAALGSCVSLCGESPPPRGAPIRRKNEKRRLKTTDVAST